VYLNIRSVAGSQPTNNLLTTALDYAQRGWQVIPLHNPVEGRCSCRNGVTCSSPGKHPRIPWKEGGSTEPAVIREWWRHWPDANVGIVTGPVSGLLILDIDGEQGRKSLRALEQQHGQLPDTWSVTTGSGGVHLYFRWPRGLKIRNSAKKIAPGIDIRGDGGYVVAPPSLHQSGRHYVLNETAIAPVECPDWMLTLLQSPPGREPKKANVVERSAKAGATTTSYVVLDSISVWACLGLRSKQRCSPRTGKSVSHR